MELLQFFPIARPIADEAMSDLQSEISVADLPRSTFEYKESIDAAPTKVLTPVQEFNDDDDDDLSHSSASSTTSSSSDSEMLDVYDDMPSLSQSSVDSDALSSEGSEASSINLAFQEADESASSSSFDDASSDNLSDLSGISELQDILLNDANSDASFGSESEDELLQILSSREERPTKVLTGSQLDSAFNRFSKGVLTNKRPEDSADKKAKSAEFSTYDKKIGRHRLHLPNDPSKPDELVPTTFVFAYCAEVNNTDPLVRKYLWAACADQLTAISEVSATETDDSEQESYVKRKKDNGKGAAFKVGEVMQFLLKDPKNEIKQLKFCDYDENASKCGSVNGTSGGILLVDEAYVDMLNEDARNGRPPPSQADYERQRENAIQQLQMRRNGPIKKGRLGVVTDMTGAVADILPVVKDEVKPNYVQMDAEKVCQLLNQSTAFAKAEADSCTPENTHGACVRAETMKDGIAAGSECVYTGNSHFPTLQINVGDLMSVIDLKGGCVDALAGGGTGDRVPVSKQLNDSVTQDILERAVGTEYATRNGAKITAADYDTLPTEVKEALCETVPNPERQKGWVYLRDLHQDAAFAHKEPLQYPATASAELRKRQKENQAIIMAAKEAIKASLKDFIAASKQEQLQADWFQQDRRVAREKINTHLVKRAADAEWVEKQMRKAELQRQESDTSKVRSQSRYVNSEYKRLREMFEERQQRIQNEIDQVTGVKADEDQLDKELKSAQTKAIKQVQKHYSAIYDTLRRKNPQEVVATDEYKSSTLPTVDELTAWVTAEKGSEEYGKFQALVKEAHKALDDTPNTLSSISSEQEESSEPWTPAGEEEEEEELMFSESTSDASSFASSDSGIASSDYSLSSDGGWSTLSSEEALSDGGLSTLSDSSNDTLTSVFDSEWHSLNDSAVALLHNVLKPSTDLATTELTIDLISGVPTKTKTTDDLSLSDQQDLALVYAYLADKGNKMIAVVNAFDSGRIEERSVEDELERLQTLVNKDYSKGSWEQYEDAYSEVETILQRRNVSLEGNQLLSGTYCNYFNNATLKEELHAADPDGRCVSISDKPNLIQVSDKDRLTTKGKFNSAAILKKYKEVVNDESKQQIPWGAFLRVTRPISRLGKTEYLIFGDEDKQFPFANVLLDAYYFALSGGIYTSMDNGDIYVAQMPVTEVTSAAMSENGMNVIRPPFPSDSTIEIVFGQGTGWQTTTVTRKSERPTSDTAAIGVDIETEPNAALEAAIETLGDDDLVQFKTLYEKTANFENSKTFVVNEAALKPNTWSEFAQNVFTLSGNANLLSFYNKEGSFGARIWDFMKSTGATANGEEGVKMKKYVLLNPKDNKVTLDFALPAALGTKSTDFRTNISEWLPTFMVTKMIWETYWYRIDLTGNGQDKQGCRMFGGPRKLNDPAIADKANQSVTEPKVYRGWYQSKQTGTPTGVWDSRSKHNPCEGEPDRSGKMFAYRPWFSKNQKDIVYAAVVATKLYVESDDALNEALDRPFEKQEFTEVYNATFTKSAYPTKTKEDARALLQLVRDKLATKQKQAKDTIPQKAIFVYDQAIEANAGQYTAQQIDEWIRNTIDVEVVGQKIAEIMDDSLGGIDQMSESIKADGINKATAVTARKEDPLSVQQLDLSHAQRLANWDTLLNSYPSRRIGQRDFHPSVVGFQVDDISEIPTAVKTEEALGWRFEAPGVRQLKQEKRPVFPAADNLVKNNRHLLWVAAEPQDDEENVDTNIVTRKWLHQVYCQIPFLIEAVYNTLNIKSADSGGTRYDVETMTQSLKKALKPTYVQPETLTPAEKELRRRVIGFRGFARTFVAGREMVRKLGDVHLGDYLIVRHKAMQEWWHGVRNPKIAPLVFGQAQVKTDSGIAFEVVSCGYAYHCSGVREDLNLVASLKETHSDLADVENLANAQVCAAFSTGQTNDNGDKPPYYAQCGPSDELVNVSGVGVGGADLLQAHAIFERLLRRSGNAEDVKYPYSVAPNVASYFAIEALYNTNGSGLEPNEANQTPHWRERAYSDSDLERIKDTMHAYMRTPGYNPAAGRFPAPIGQVYGCYTSSGERVENAIVSAMCKSPSTWGPAMPVVPTVDDLQGRAMQPYAQYAAQQMRKLSPFPYGPFDPEKATWSEDTKNICENGDVVKGTFEATTDPEGKNSNTHMVCVPKNDFPKQHALLKVFDLEPPLGDGAPEPTAIESQDADEELGKFELPRLSGNEETVANPNTSSTRNAPGVYQTDVTFNTMHNKAFKSTQDRTSTFKSGDYTFEETPIGSNYLLATEEKFTKNTRDAIDSLLKDKFGMEQRKDQNDYVVKKFDEANAALFDLGGFFCLSNDSPTPLEEVDRLRTVMKNILDIHNKGITEAQVVANVEKQFGGEATGFFYTSCNFDASPPAFYLNFVSVLEDQTATLTAKSAAYNIPLIEALKKLCDQFITAKQDALAKVPVKPDQLSKIIRSYWQNVGRNSLSGQQKNQALISAINQELKKSQPAFIARISEIADLTQSSVAKFAPQDRRTVAGVVAADEKVKMYRQYDNGYDPVKISIP